jgi:L-seryl-tRNA(Ser) seleniumtransferase
MQAGFMSDINLKLRALPQLDAVLGCETGKLVLARFQRQVVLAEARLLMAELREGLLNGKEPGSTSEEDVARLLQARLEHLVRPAVIPVVNATGILLHTNLGRAVLTESARNAIAGIAGCYSNLEFELETGRRGKRDYKLARQLAALCGCEDATVVNNCAAAVMIALNTMAAGREVITSRGELVEIGGSYRVPDVIPAAGCRLLEVGTTNRTRIRDYETAINDNSGLLLKTHASNYRIRGFTEEASITELVELGKQHKLPVLVDLGSGYIRHGSSVVLDEPELLDTMAAGPDIVCISGDKLLGGPQAGIILGSRDWIARIRRNPLWRVLRLDKLCIAALSATVSEYFLNNPLGSSTVLGTQLEQGVQDFNACAGKLRDGLKKLQPEWTFEIVNGTGSVGGGTLPDQDFESRVVSIVPAGMTADQLDAALRQASLPVIGFVSQGRLMLNVASILDGEVPKILRTFEELHD